MFIYTELKIGNEIITPETIDKHSFSHEGNVCTIHLKDGTLISTNEKVKINGYFLCNCGKKIIHEGNIFCNDCINSNKKCSLEPFIMKNKK